MVKTIGQFTDFITSNEMVTVASAILVTPIILGSVVNFGSSVPFIGTNVWVILLIASFIIFGLTSMVPTGKARALVMGIGAGLFINFLITNPLTGKFFAGILTRGTG